MYKIIYEIKQTRHQRPSGSQITVNKQELKEWTQWLDYKNAIYSIAEI
jgi:hypothetical protein